MLRPSLVACMGKLMPLLVRRDGYDVTSVELLPSHRIGRKLWREARCETRLAGMCERGWGMDLMYLMEWMFTMQRVLSNLGILASPKQKHILSLLASSHAVYLYSASRFQTST